MTDVSVLCSVQAAYFIMLYCFQALAILQAAMYVKGRQLANGLCHDDDEACPMTMFKVKVVLLEAKCQIFL